MNYKEFCEELLVIAGWRTKKTPQPRYKTSSNGVYEFIIDTESGRSIWLKRLDTQGEAYHEALRVCGILNNWELYR